MLSPKMVQIIKRVCLYALVTVSVLILVFPVYWMVRTSLLKRGQILSFPPNVLPRLADLDLGAYRNVLVIHPVFLWFRNSIFVTGTSIFVALLFSTLAGYSMSRFRGLASSAMGGLLIVIRMLPDTLVLVPLYIMFNSAGLIDNLCSLVIYNIGLIIPFSAWMMKGFFDSIPKDLEEAAEIDGCGFVAAIYKVILPLTVPGLAATGIYASVISWANFLAARTYINDPNKWTVVVGLSSLVGEFRTLWDELMAMATISILPLIILFMFLVKKLVGGMAAGAVKQ